MRLSIIGATGGVGTELVAQAIAAGHEVRALARHPKRVTLIHPRLSVIPGDAVTGQGLSDVMDGADVLLSALGSRSWFRPIVAAGTRQILSAAAASGVKRAILISAVGVGDSRAQMRRLSKVFGYLVQPLLLGAVYRDLAAAEHIAKDSGIPVVIVRPSGLTHGPLIGKLVAIGPDGDVPPRISRKDVAAFMLSLLQEARWDGKAVSIGAE